ncbi:MAG: hydantoinase/oxoprolinase family protein [Deltaproteobacteria bacterium]|nr:hydantoinase/oxoprolinase family protein [Deltaproteobacteria bacterium]
MIVSIDVGGTFTDCLVVDAAGAVRAFKAPTTPRSPADGVMQVLAKAATAYRQSPGEFVGAVELIIHGTTLATNALVERRGATVGMLTTKGFRDILALRRGFKNVGGRSMYDVFFPPYRPLVPRRHCLPVTERMNQRGQVVTPLDEGDVRGAAETLMASGVTAVAVGFLHSYANGSHEARAAEILREAFPQAYVVTSHEILPVWGEFERFSTTVASAFVGPIVSTYLNDLGSRLDARGLKGRLLLVQADGHVQSVGEVARKAVYLVGSGPAAAPTAGTFIGDLGNHRDLISIDMGGTSFDVCLVRDGQVETTTEMWVGEERLAIKMRDIHTVGAGGGSIAWVDSLGLLRVGPQSAGAEPGPACYGRSGLDPTVTDAALVLGYIPADYFLGGEIALDTGLAHEALGRLGARLGMDAAAAAQAVFQAVNGFMASQITEISTRRGYDVRDFALVAGGGAGPVHAGFLAELLGIRTVIVPQAAALYSALGMLLMDIGRDYARTLVSPAAGLDIGKVNGVFAAMEAEALAAFRAVGIPPEEVRLARSADMRYAKQFHEIEVELPSRPLESADIGAVLEAFHRQHEARYTFAMSFRAVDFITFRLHASASRRAELRLAAGQDAPVRRGTVAAKRRRRAFFGGVMQEVPVYDGPAVPQGYALKGPAIIEEQTTTVVVPPGFVTQVDSGHNYILVQGG